MKIRDLIGIILVSSSLFFTSCVDLTPEPVPNGYHYKEFGMLETKARSVSWVDGDKVCMYSLAEDGTILHKDTVAITNINRNAGKIKALVANKSYKYFVTYPHDAIKSEIGEILNDEDFRVNLSGNFTDVSVMTEYLDTLETSIYMENRFSLLNLDKSTYYGTVTIESAFPSTSTFTRGNGEYWIPLSYRDETVKITVRTTIGNGKGKREIVREKSLKTTPGVVYSPKSW